MRREKPCPVAHWHDSLGDDVMVFSAPISDIPSGITRLVVVVLVPLLRCHYANVVE